MTMAAGKASDLLSASWKPTEAGSIIQFDSKGLRIWRGNEVNPSLGAGDVSTCSSPISGARKERMNSPFLSLLFFWFT